MPFPTESLAGVVTQAPQASHPPPPLAAASHIRAEAARLTPPA